jgi:hypothetical protein
MGLFVSTVALQKSVTPGWPPAAPPSYYSLPNLLNAYSGVAEFVAEKGGQLMGVTDFSSATVERLQYV